MLFFGEWFIRQFGNCLLDPIVGLWLRPLKQGNQPIWCLNDGTLMRHWFIAAVGQLGKWTHAIAKGSFEIYPGRQFARNEIGFVRRKVKVHSPTRSSN